MANPGNSDVAAALQMLLARLEPLLPPRREVDWTAPAFRWRKRQYLGVPIGHLEPVRRVARIAPDDLQHIDEQRAAILRNTEQFMRGLPANNVLLTGARGTGKSSLIRACLAQFHADGLRLIEVDKNDLTDLPDIVALVAARPERFILFCDDLSFEPGDAAYKPLKAALDGSIAGLPDNVLICATSNRRHLMPEFFAENEATQHQGGEVRPAESIEEKISLSDRFGLTLTFWPFNQDDYLAIVAAWVAALGGSATQAMRQEAVNWAIARGGRSGRVARQFAADWVGRQGLQRRRKG